MMNPDAPFASIVVPTRNRAHVLRRALRSLQEQHFTDFEAIVVDDGSSGDSLAEMRTLANELPSGYRVVWRDAGAPRRSPASARNAGIAAARGRFVGFLDDDDYWTDPAHLQRAFDALTRAPDADFYIADQVALRGEECIVDCWLPYLQRVARQREPVLAPDVFAVRHADLLQPEGIGFTHVNISLVARELLLRTGGFWEETAYEEDLDFALRIADAARKILYCTSPVSVNTLRHDSDVPGASTLCEESKLLFRVLVCQHALLECRRPEVIAYARLRMSGALKALAKRNHAAGKHRLAADLAAQAAGVDRSLRWIGIAAYLRLRSLISARVHAN